jgi:diguanylate cyclase (GGDEF)-like protein/PAS domain S-box-containing protein
MPWHSDNRKFWNTISELEESGRSKHLQLVVENTDSIVLRIDKQGRITFINHFALSFFGFSKDELVGHNVLGTIVPRTESTGRDMSVLFQDLLTHPHRYVTNENENICKNGQKVWISWINAPLLDETGGLAEIICIGNNISQCKQAEEALRLSESYYRAIFETSGTAIIIIEDDATISHVNSHFEELSGYSRQEVEGRKSWIDFVHPHDAAEVREHLFWRRRDRDLTLSQCEHRFIDRNGKEHHVLMSVNLIRETNQSVASFIDITGRKEMEKRLEEMSLYDSLTGLYNRNFFEAEMGRFSNGRYAPVGIVVCDLDGLKLVNDTLGHNSGDEMIVNAARLLKHSFRSSDIVARIGGDEFAVLVPDTPKKDAPKLVQRLRKAVEEHNAHNPKIPLFLAIGYAISDKDTPNMQHLFREADNRMYREKIQNEQSARSALVQGLTSAIEARDFAIEGHCDRLQELATPLARAEGLTENRINDLLLFARFHDLGKVGIPDRILFKPGPLTREEYRQMKGHCEIGHRIADSVMDLKPIAEWILKHHEQWDGQGYPLGLQGRDIPLECRILAIADAYEAMTSDRPYRTAMPREKAFRELRRCAGTQFDPDLTEQFVSLLESTKGTPTSRQ